MEAMGQMILSEALLAADTKDREFEAVVREHAGTSIALPRPC